jgi:hypothetical protein
MFIVIVLCFLAAFLSVEVVEGSSSSWSDNLEFIGRFSNNNGTYRADWPGSSVRLHVSPSATEVRVVMTFSSCTGSCNFYVLAELDCQAVQKFEINPNQLDLKFSFSSAIGSTREVNFIKITEGSCANAEGIMEISSVTISGADLTEKSNICNRAHSLLFFGDSLVK